MATQRISHLNKPVHSIRNFWIEAEIDGRKEILRGGPSSKDGGLTLRVFIRDNASVVHALTIDGHARPDGELELTARDYVVRDASNRFTDTPTRPDGEVFWRGIAAR